MKAFSLFPLLSVLLALLPLFPAARGADPTAAPSPDAAVEKIQALAKSLVDAPDDEARRRLLAATPTALADDERLRRKVNAMAGQFIFTGEYDRAAALNTFVHRWCEAHGDAPGVAIAEWGAGNIDGNRGNNGAALEHFEHARRFFADTGDTRREAGVLQGTSVVHIRLGDYRQALAEVETALAIHRPTGNKESILSDLQAIGNIYLNEGQPERADGYYDEATKEAGDDETWQVYLFQNMASSRAAQGDLPGAIALSEKTLVLARKIKDQPRVASDLASLGGYEVESGRLADAEGMFREALSLAESLGEKGRQAVALIGLSDVVARRAERPGSAAEALEMAQRASALARETGNASEVWQARTIAGRLLRLAGRQQEARAALEEAIAAIEDTRGRLSGGDVQATEFFEDKLVPYQEMVALLAGEDQPVEALAYAERAKARVLLEVLRGPRNGFDETLSPAERTTLKEHEERIAVLNRELATVPPAQKVAVADRLRDARLARQATEDDLLAAHPELRRQVSLRAERSLSATALGSLLGPGGAGNGTVLLDYVVGTDETWVFVVRQTAAGEAAGPNVSVFRLPLGRAALAARTEHYRRTLANRGLDWTREARALGEDLLGPIRPALAGAKSLVIVPDGPLWELPFQTLPAARGEGELRAGETLAAWPLSISPSLGFLLQSREKMAAHPQPDAGSTRLLAFGDPAVGARAPGNPDELNTKGLGGDESNALPEAGREVAALGALYGADNSRVFMGRKASVVTFRQEAAGDYDVIHFATHGTYNDRAPLYSHLVLSQVDLPADEDGLLEAWKLMRLPLHARLVVLSACETARGRVGAGEGVIGLSWALFTAGCRACVASQWKVDSESNTALMLEFHRQLRQGVGPARALREASLALAKQPETRHPFYWAPFVVIGDGD